MGDEGRQEHSCDRAGRAGLVPGEVVGTLLGRRDTAAPLDGPLEGAAPVAVVARSAPGMQGHGLVGVGTAGDVAVALPGAHDVVER